MILFRARAGGVAPVAFLATETTEGRISMNQKQALRVGTPTIPVCALHGWPRTIKQPWTTDGLRETELQIERNFILFVQLCLRDQLRPIAVDKALIC